MLVRLNTKKLESDIISEVQSFLSINFGAETEYTIKMVNEFTARARQLVNSRHFDIEVRELMNEYMVA